MGSGIRVVIAFFIIPACLGIPIKSWLAQQGHTCANICLGATTDLVCGSDGLTHWNPCVLQAYNCSGHSSKVVVQLHQGSCTAEPNVTICSHLLTGKIQCPEKKDAICGLQDQRTYTNYCQLLEINCKTRPGVEVAYRGPCRTEEKWRQRTPISTVTGPSASNASSLSHKMPSSSTSSSNTSATDLRTTTTFSASL